MTTTNRRLHGASTRSPAAAKLVALAVAAAVALQTSSALHMAAACGQQAPGTVDPTVEELAASAPITIAGVVEAAQSMTPSERWALVEVTCAFSAAGSGPTSGVAAGALANISNFGNSATCQNEPPPVGEMRVFFVSGDNDNGYRLHYDTQFSAVQLASQANLLEVVAALNDTDGNGGAAGRCSTAVIEALDAAEPDGGDTPCTWWDGTTVPSGHGGKDRENCNDCSCMDGLVLCTLKLCFDDAGTHGATASGAAMLLGVVGALVTVAARLAN